MPQNIWKNKIFLDTNIIVDIIDKNRTNHFYSVKLIELAIENNIEIAISEDMLTTVFYVVKDKNNVLNYLDYITKKWNIYHYGNELIKEAINISLKQKVDLEDVLQCLCAKYNNCNIMITNDKKLYNCGIKIMTSKEFMEKFKNENSLI